MLYKIIILAVSFCFLSLIQGSFLTHFSVLGASPNLVLILVCLFTFFEKHKTYYGVISAFAGGLFLDIFSSSFIGASIFSLLIVYFLVKLLLYYLKNISPKYSVFYFIIILICSAVFFDFILASLSLSLFFNGYVLLIKIAYDLVIGVIGFYLFKLSYALL